MLSARIPILVFGCGMCRRAKRLRVSISMSTPSCSLLMVPALQRGVNWCKRRYADWWDSRTYHEDGSHNLRIINLDLAAKIPDFHVGIFMPSAGEGIKLLKGEVQRIPFEGHANEVKFVAYSADGKQIASSSSSYDFTVRVWDVSTGSRRTFRETCSTSSVAFSPDCTQLASDSALFNLSTGSRKKGRASGFLIHILGGWQISRFGGIEAEF